MRCQAQGCKGLAQFEKRYCLTHVYQADLTPQSNQGSPISCIKCIAGPLKDTPHTHDTPKVDELEKLSNFNLIKYTDHYVLTIDRGMGKPIIYEGDTLGEVLQQLTKDKLNDWREK